MISIELDLGHGTIAVGPVKYAEDNSIGIIFEQLIGAQPIGEKVLTGNSSNCQVAIIIPCLESLDVLEKACKNVRSLLDKSKTFEQLIEEYNDKAS